MTFNKICLGTIFVVAGLTVVASQGRRDHVAGAGDVTIGGVDVSFGMAANSGPNGENPKGHIMLDWPTGSTHFAIDCLAVSGNNAVIGGSGPEGNILILIQDNGEPGANADRFYIVPGQTCGGFYTDPGPLPAISRGNIQVSDGI